MRELRGAEVADALARTIAGQIIGNQPRASVKLLPRNKMPSLEPHYWPLLHLRIPTYRHTHNTVIFNADIFVWCSGGRFSTCPSPYL